MTLPENLPQPSRGNDEKGREHAIALAKKAGDCDEVPVGAVLVRQNQIIGEGYNQPIANHDASAHAEIMALRDAGQREQNYRFPDTTLYVTLEPCVMCAGAIVHARISRLVYGAFDSKTGVIDTTMKLYQQLKGQKITWQGGVLSDRCGKLLKDFFETRR